MPDTIQARSSLHQAARAMAYAMALEQIDPSEFTLFKNDTVGHYFECLRKEAPVHRSRSAVFGCYWSVTRYQDIMAVDANHHVYSSDVAYGSGSAHARCSTACRATRPLTELPVRIPG